MNFNYRYFFILILAFAGSAVVAPLPALAETSSACIVKHVPQAKPVGTGRLTVMVWDVYDATLYAPRGTYDAGRPFSLKLKYLREIKGSDIAQTSVQEMRRLGLTDEQKLNGYYKQLVSIIPDVDKHTELTGIYTASGETVFCKGHKEIGRVTDKNFGRYFFGIWLDEQSTAPDLRRRLLGKPR